MLELKNMTYSYAKTKGILNDINVSFTKASTAIVGPNGAGKTTLVKILKGLLLPQKGSVTLDGIKLSDMNVQERAQHIGFVFQNPNEQIFQTTVEKEVLFGVQCLGIPESEAHDKVNKALQDVHLLAHAQDNPHELTLGQKKSLCIASVLVMEPAVIILDEPTIGQDAHGKKTLQELIQKLSAAGTTIIAVLHDMSFVAECFERMLVMVDGEIIADDETTSVFAQEQILRQAKLELPPVATLAYQLGAKDLILSVSDFVLWYNNKEK